MPYLQFKGKTAVETFHYSLPHHTLELEPGLSVLAEGQDPSLDGNVLIEGDNLLALKSLLPTHAGRIKCIYIDLPHNTGNEGWVYNDNLTQPQFKEWIGEVVGKEGEDACRHDKWCCMMYPRLMLLKELLREDGAIFVSIDDNEVNHLRDLMDEIFGEDNFVDCVIWQKKVSPSNDAIYFSSDHDYILVYAKLKMVWRPQRSGKNKRQKDYYKNPDNDLRGDWNSATYTCNKSDVERPNLYYAIINPNTGEEVWPKKTAVWAYSRKAHELHVKDNMIYWGKDGKASAPRLKKFFLDTDDVVTRSIWPYSEVGHTQEASGEIAKIFAEVNFATPKPVRLIKRILQIATEENDIVLDSFAGSGTTAQAVLEINAEDGGDRKFVLIQQKYDSKDDERAHVNICQTITRERVHRVMEGYSFQGTKAETLLEEKVGLNTLRKADELLGRIEAAKEQGRTGYDEVRAEMKEGVVKVEGVKKVTERMEGLGGSFTYARVSDNPLFGEFRDLGEELPAYEELAKYIFYTETSRQWRTGDMNRATGKIGEHAGTSYYLLYTPNHDADSGLDTPFLKQIAAADPNPRLVVYCEKFWMHRDDLRRWEIAQGKSVRPMIVPFNLK